MKKTAIIISAVILLGAAALFFMNSREATEPAYDTLIPKDTVSAMHITSDAFPHEGRIPSLYTCDDENVSPPLDFHDVPEGAVTLALIADDPDAPMGTWVHWTVWNIDPSVPSAAEGEVPSEGIEGMTSFGRAGYGGPCPPSGEHRYFFKLYALDTRLDLSADTDAEELVRVMEGHVLAYAELIGLYSRE